MTENSQNTLLSRRLLWKRQSSKTRYQHRKIFSYKFLEKSRDLVIIRLAF